MPDERLYLRVFNLGPSPIYIKPGDKVFAFEFHTLDGAIPGNVLEDIERHGSMKRQIEDEFFKPPQAQYPGFMAAVRDEVERKTQGDIHDLRVRVESVEGGTRNVVLFGIFIVAASILGVALAVLLQLFGQGLTTLQMGTGWKIASLIGTLLVAIVLAIGLVFSIGRVIWVVSRDFPKEK